jgi:lipopolysaccharide biosynthesis protein
MSGLLTQSPVVSTPTDRSIGRTGERAARAIALYLPQFHPIPENDRWWGTGFTEWTNVTKARPLFRGHNQPRLPADLGYYDLRVPETRAAQADLARRYGIEAFCYYHYWFGNGRRLLERPFEEVLRSGEPDFPFCLCWANETWSGAWHGAHGRILMEQSYPGAADLSAHADWLLEAFGDPRYVQVDGKPIFFVYRPLGLSDSRRVTDYWRDRAIKAGFPGLHLVAFNEDRTWDPRPDGFDAVTIPNLHVIRYMPLRNLKYRIRRSIRAHPRLGQLANRCKPEPLHVYPYDEASDHFVIKEELGHEYYPIVIPDWDNTARSGLRGYALHGSTPELFRRNLQDAVARVAAHPADRRIVIIESWNEWAEGNYLEPDRRWGHEYLRVAHSTLTAACRS